MKNKDFPRRDCVTPQRSANIDKRISLQTYNIACLDKSWIWLNDPEIRELTMTPVFTRENQIEFYEQLTQRTDYLIWGVILDKSELIGAAGLKNHRGTLAEYWGFIGEKKHWNKGLGRQLIETVEQQARDFDFTDLDLKVSASNQRAIGLYEKVGFVIDRHRSNNLYLHMLKRNI